MLFVRFKRNKRKAQINFKAVVCDSSGLEINSFGGYFYVGSSIIYQFYVTNN